MHMDANITFSFIMPAYKKLFLYKAIDSILKQTYTNFELIIVDDDSPEKLLDVIRLFHDERIKYLKNPINIGGSDLVANWNQCIKHANNDYIILATDDDLFDPYFLSEAVLLITKYPNVNIVRSGVQKIDENGNTLDIEFPLKEYMTDREFTILYAKGGMISCVSNYIFKKDALTEIGGFISFPKAHFSDDATALALSNNGVACIQSNLFNFRVSTINLSNQGNLNVVLEQIKATELFMTWYLNHVKKLDCKLNDFFETVCYGGIKTKYIYLIDKLIAKIPIFKMILALRIISSTQHLFKKDKLFLSVMYFINKI